MTDAIVTFNPRPHIERRQFAPGVFCLIIDDALLHPEQMVEVAVAQREALQPAAFNAYPGVQFPTADEISRRLDEFFSQHVRALLGARRTLRMHARLSMVTLPPSTLQPRQSICHRDSQGVAPEHCIAASVLYLFRDSALGGTSFFVPRQSALETALLVHDSSTMSSEEFARKYAIAPGYMTSSNDYFKCVGSVAAKWNRLIFYDGALFHSGNIAQPSRLSSDPLVGRLTLNGFFTCTRKAR